MSFSVTFHGAAQTVTGSCMVVASGDTRMLIDCGMFQGNKTLKELNYRPFPFNVQDIDAVLVTHAHIDHSGLLPKLRLAGYQGPIIATPATVELAKCLLPDSGGIQEMEVKRLNYRNAQRGRGELRPIYRRADGEETADSMTARGFDSWFEIAKGVRARFWRAGHILGAASIELEAQCTRALFSGDLGSFTHGIEGVPQSPSGLDLVVMEGTYGNRLRTPIDSAARVGLLAAEVERALKAGGNLIIPAFAVERTQEMLLDLLSLDPSTLPSHKIFLDSPLAAKATEVFAAHAGANGGSQFDLNRRGVKVIQSVEESIALDRIASGAIIVSASGMCDAGRVREHLKANLWRAESTVLLVGYMAPGTLGALLHDGKKRVRIHGQDIVVRSQIRSLDSYSGHADQAELMTWLRARGPISSAVALVHGEGEVLSALSDLIRAEKLAPVLIPALDQTLTRAADGTCSLSPATNVAAGRLTTDERQAAQSGWDWHNDYAAFLVQLQEQLEHVADAKERRRLLRRLEDAFETAPAPRRHR
jgi:metallo-beta-lactamase family protein